MGKPTLVTNRITELRTAASMSQGELGDQVGVTRQTVNAIERGRYSPSLEVAFKIARVFGVPLEGVFQYPDQPGTTASANRIRPAGKEDRTGSQMISDCPLRDREPYGSDAMPMTRDNPIVLLHGIVLYSETR